MNIIRISLFEKIIIFLNASMDGLATTALLTACYWYTITPIAPMALTEMCHEPLDFYIITLLSTLSIVVALPIAYFRYQQLLKTTYHSCRLLFKQSLLYRKHYQIQFQSPHSLTIQGETWLTCLMSALTISGVILSTGWTYASLFIGSTIMKEIPQSAWECFALCCILLSSMLGCAIGYVKHKNMKRETLIRLLKQVNHQQPPATRNCFNRYTVNYSYR